MPVADHVTYARYLCPACRQTQVQGGLCPNDRVPLLFDRSGMVLAKRYRFRRPLGRGAMGLIWEAEQLTLQRRVALKITPATDEETNVRFRRGAMIMGKMSHPNIARIHDFGQEDGPEGLELYLVMERLEGAPLSRYASKRALSVGRSIEASIQALAALEHVHRHGYIHRDVKPANLFVTAVDEGNFVLKLLDFGIARHADTGDTNEDAPSKAQMCVTQPLKILGTPEYMAPEQILGQPLDHRIDLYAVGVMLFSFLTGALPFQGPDRYQTYAAHLRQETPSVSAFGMSEPASLRWDRWFRRALAKSRNDRFQSATEMIRSLEELRVVLRKFDALGAVR